MQQVLWLLKTLLINSILSQLDGMTEVHTAGGKCKSSMYKVNIILPNGVLFPHVRVTQGISGYDIGLLIGMDIISCGDFSVTNANGKTIFHLQRHQQDLSIL